MAINSDTDITLALIQLGKSEKNSVRLSQSIPPHEIIEWHSDNPDSQPTDDELNAAYIAWKNANEYKEKRVKEYPDFASQLDDIFHNGIDGWKSTIKAIKDKYPKS
tara:strand:- start:10 stop:327 length:318 start_codon:yes stop_codon:yes gene_type:complete